MLTRSGFLYVLNVGLSVPAKVGLQDTVARREVTMQNYW